MKQNIIYFTVLITLIGLVNTGNLKRKQKSSRQKRSTSFCTDYFSFITGHSVCVSVSNSLVNSGVSDAEKILIVDTHNNYRSSVNPTAEDMVKLTWNDEIAIVAQAWANNCVFEHDENYHRYVPGKYQLGQNLAYASGSKRTWDAMITAWHNEVHDFTYYGDNSGAVVGHYTQMVSGKATLIGCGYADCGSNHLYVCDYGPPGKTNNQPYTNGTTCAQCPGRCTNGLCDCNGVVCWNGGTLDFNTCTCQCLNFQHFIGDNCALNCSLLSEPGSCGKGVLVQANCPVFSNLPYTCPDTCGICPYGGIDYINSLLSVLTTGAGSTVSGTTVAVTGTTTQSSTESGGGSSEFLPSIFSNVLVLITCISIRLVL